VAPRLGAAPSGLSACIRDRTLTHDYEPTREAAMAAFATPMKPVIKRRVGVTSEEEVGMDKILFSLTFATALLALASSEASAFIYSSFVCQAVGARSVAWGRSFFVADAKLIALSRCARRSGICTISYCVPG
jgi:hypothetical protein